MMEWASAFGGFRHEKGDLTYTMQLVLPQMLYLLSAALRSDHDFTS